MNATTVAVDLAKNTFEIAVADPRGKVVQRARLTRAQFARWFDDRAVALVVMEACGSAHHWARWLHAKGLAVKLLPARHVRPYVRRSKTDAADCLALLEAARAPDIAPRSPARSAAPMGAPGPGENLSQQGRRRARQQARAHRLGNLAPRARLPAPRAARPDCLIPRCLSSGCLETDRPHCHNARTTAATRR